MHHFEDIFCLTHKCCGTTLEGVINRGCSDQKCSSVSARKSWMKQYDTSVKPQSTYFTVRGQSYFSRLPKYWPPPSPSSPGESVLPPQQRRGVHTRRGERGDGGSIFWKTREIGLPSYSKICTLWFNRCVVLFHPGFSGWDARTLLVATAPIYDTIQSCPAAFVRMPIN